MDLSFDWGCADDLFCVECYLGLLLDYVNRL